MIPASNDDLDTRTFKAFKQQFLQQNLDKCLTNRNSKLLSHCRRSVSLDPILWAPVSNSERSRCIQWKLGWLPAGKPKPCPRHPAHHLSKKHAINCLNMHRRLFMSETIPDPLSFLLNMLPSHPSAHSGLALSWSQHWPTICSILHELDQLHHATTIPATHPHGHKLLEWIKQFL
ncbi:hypothetical protein G6F57_010291 [Rhizopus arrhizus]|uniref:Uncharacterized protein n=1 Tax=Rhizopus oryzae TaxID=64495 RepID=A0A9P6WY27_RHIOR|nr:hypothetical protein G6F23_010559 [Rhizopus arrhizus]KAG0754653.1 hypothetical protein G6F24_012339 [Rhizopus arrhizus]KAG0759491.1 hypothetical protein G6F22_019366 [Rhizopus arrhizus]KAG0780685.1 hypothetical protein G6F21_012018 [Rhizopus arrhizus]KAG0824936.1 hypothetical protein G6F18_010643 [Rhizopus arrhizus]